MIQNDIYSDLSSFSYEDWKQKLLKDLKGKDISELDWLVEEGIRIPAFQNKETSKARLHLAAKENAWLIEESIGKTNAKSANEQALEALEGGAQSIFFECKNYNSSDIPGLLKGIQAEWVALYFNQVPEGFAAALVEFYRANNFNLNSISGGIFGQEEAIGIENYAGQVIAIPFQKNRSEYIADMLIHLEAAFEGKRPNGKILLQWEIGEILLLEIAAIRALRFLIQSIQQKLAPSFEIVLSGRSSLEQHSEDADYNKIRLVNQAMAGILGGVDILNLHPSDAKTGEPDGFSRRISRNISHILKAESHLDSYSNPVDGSYFIEQLSHEIAKKAWNLFRTKSRS